MRKFTALLLVLVLAVTLAACGNGQGTPEGNSSGNISQVFPRDILSVVHPDFKLTDGFIEPVEKLTAAPEGFIPITTADEFCKISLNPAANYILMADIQLPGTGWERIVNFRGILDGNGYTVRNAGDTLFTSIAGGTVKNLGVYGDLTGVSSGIVYHMKDGAMLLNCWFDGSVTCDPDGVTISNGLVNSAKNAQIISCYNAADISAGNCSAGVVGEIREAVTVKNCFNTGTIQVNTASQFCVDGIAGGVVGQMSIGDSDGGASNVTNCRNSGTVTGLAAAGIMGYVYITEPVSLYIQLCYNEGTVRGKNAGERVASAGGITNVMVIEEGYVTVSDCYNTGACSLGGIDGGEMLQRAWDLVSGDLDHVRIERCFNTEAAAAGISLNAKNLDCCYFADTSENATYDGALFATVKRLTAAQMALKASFEGFDFDAVWQMGSKHPVFRQTSY